MRNNRSAVYSIVENLPGNPLIIRDMCNGGQLSVTNDAELVVEELHNQGLLPNNRRLFYYDTDNQLDELVHDGPVFKGFAPGPQ